MNKVYIVLLNYNGWQDTQECLESVLKLDYCNYQIIVVDNDSPNNSMDNLLAWARGDEVATVDNLKLAHLSTPHIIKPVNFVLYDKKTALQGGCVAKEAQLNNPIVFIQSGENKGFSAGNNIGIQYAIAKGDAEYIWLLNNDTVVESDALTALERKALYYKDKGHKVSIIGAKLMYYHQPELIQAVGGKYNKWLATTSHIGAFERDLGQFDSEEFIRNINYPVGASMFVNVAFVKDVGLMCEDYFLYFEELDWVIRGKKKEWKVGYAWSAKVFHKEGVSIGLSAKSPERSDFGEYYSLKNRLIFTRKFYPSLLLSIRLSFIFVLINRFKRKQFYKLPMVIKLMFSNV